MNTEVVTLFLFCYFFFLFFFLSQSSFFHFSLALFYRTGTTFGCLCIGDRTGYADQMFHGRFMSHFFCVFSDGVCGAGGGRGRRGRGGAGGGEGRAPGWREETSKGGRRRGAGGQGGAPGGQAEGARAGRGGVGASRPEWAG